jgi:hypothetical protein
VPAGSRDLRPTAAEKILTSRSAREGERKQVTVLFADVRGRLVPPFCQAPPCQRTMCSVCVGKHAPGS